ncbi:transposase [Janthinobacterium sp. CG_23.3]
MRKIHEVLRLHFEQGRSKREIARIINVSPSTVSDYVARAKQARLSTPLPPNCNDTVLERLLFPPSEPSSVQRPAPARPTVHNELRRKGVTLELEWQKYKAEKPDDYKYSAFCEHYRRWRQQLTLSMRQTHTPGERLFIDYAGQTLGVTDGSTGEIRAAQAFVAVLGVSNYTYIEATWSQQLPDWIDSPVRARVLRRLRRAVGTRQPVQRQRALASHFLS